MKKAFTLLIAMIIVASLSQAQNTWEQKADFGGTTRASAVGFSIGTKGYIGTGYGAFEGISTTYDPLKDFWEYDPSSNVWTQKAEFVGEARYGSVGFNIDSKGYMGTGRDYYTGYEDFWEYDPAANAWTKKADFGGGLKSNGVGLSIVGKGYIGTGGYGFPDKRDFWEYTPGGCPPPANLKVLKISDTCARLNWYLPNIDVDNIKISYRPLGNPKWKEERKKPTTTSIRICGLTPNTTYEWKVRNICADNKTDWVNGTNFTTMPSTAISSIAESFTNNKVPGNINLNIVPNPNGGNFSLQMRLPDNAASTMLSLYNNFGVKLWQQDAGKLSGFVNKNMALENRLSAGVYVLIVQHGDERLMQKVVVVK